MPLIRRLPKRGFANPFKKRFQVVNIQTLNAFSENEVVTPELLREKNIIKSKNIDVKILGNGEIKKPLTVKANAFSKSAQDKIAKAGGNTEIIKTPRPKVQTEEKPEVEKK
jgi:large subunit ribosomal protein L15